MKKTIIPLFATVLMLSGTAYAEDVSINDALYVSKPVFSCSGRRLSALQTGVTYDSIDISFCVEPNFSDLTEKNLTAAAAVYENGVLKSVSTQSAPCGCEPQNFSLTLDSITPTDESFSLKLLLWDDYMRPYTDGAALTATQDSDEYSDMEIIRSRIEAVSSLYSTTADPSSLLALLGSDGKFTDIDYSYTTEKSTWEPSEVFPRAITLCSAYFTEGNPYYMDTELKSAIDSILNDWCENLYTSVNWWFNEISVPQSLSKLLLYPFDENEAYLATLKTLALKGMPEVDESLPHKTDDTGGNLTDKLQIGIKIAAATRDEDAMKNVISYLLDNELSVFSYTNAEGIMPDYSFHQHGSFFYDGSYGNVFCSGINTLLGYLEDSSFMVSERALNTYADYILDGHSWFFKNGGSDFACFGRAISRKNGVGTTIKSDSLGAVNILTALPGLDRREELLALKADRLISDDCTTSAAKHFYLSDMTVMQRPDFYIGVRTSSDRNINTEYMNGENSKASFISDGATTIMRDGTEYKNIFALWDWSRIPGTTTEYLSEMPTMTSSYQYGLCEFVGGASDGLNAVSVMNYERRSTTAKKSYFLFGSGMTALGAGITDTDADTEVCTTINQCLQDGQVRFCSDGTQQTFTTGSVTMSDMSWVLHDKIGYFFPDGEDVTVKTETRTGSWYDINTSQSKDSTSAKVFTLYTSHGTEPDGDTYAYTVLPGVDKTSLAEYAADPDMIVVENTTAVSCVWSKSQSGAGIVFWTKVPASGAYSESVTLPADVTGLDEDLTVDALRDPCIVMLNKTDEGFDLYVSNPKNNTLADTYLAINRHLGGDGTQWDGTKTTLTVNFPQGTLAGSTVKYSLALAE